MGYSRPERRVVGSGMLAEPPGDDLLALDEAITALAREDPAPPRWSSSGSSPG